MQRMKIAVLVAVVGGIMGCQVAGGMAKAEREFSLSAAWQDYEHIVVKSRNGAIELTSADVPEILIDGKMYVRGITQAEADANLEKLQIVAEADSANPKAFRIELKVPEKLRRNSPGAKFIIKIPSPCTAEINTSNGSVKVVGLKGPVVLDTSNGGIRAEKIDGDLKADTSNGGVVVKDVSGKCVINTSNGAIEVEGVCGDIHADTSNGNIRVDASPPRTATVILDTSNGSIDATLPAHMSADLKLATSNGRVRVDFSDIPTKLSRQSKTHLTGSMNGGEGGRIVADTSNGSITLKFRK